MDEKPIFVWDACGVFGWLIPWAAWKFGERPIFPTRDWDRCHVYMYSKLGQLGEYDPTPHGPPSHIPLNVDDYIDYTLMNVDWTAVRKHITEAIA